VNEYRPTRRNPVGVVAGRQRWDMPVESDTEEGAIQLDGGRMHYHDIT
jgi:hypothetical protein